MKPTRYHPCDIRPRNGDQEVALSLMNDPDIKLVVLSGVAGSGKTLLACAHAMEKFKRGDVSRIIITKSLTPVGREIGYLKGDMKQKVQPWLGAFYDNLIHCGVADFHIDDMIERRELEITPITYIQGRSISNAIILIDEVQNLEISVIKQIITRAGENTQVILVGDPTQVFERLSKPGMPILIEKAKDADLAGYVDMQESVRSELANWGVLNL